MKGKTAPAIYEFAECMMFFAGAFTCDEGVLETRRRVQDALPKGHRLHLDVCLENKIRDLVRLSSRADAEAREIFGTADLQFATDVLADANLIMEYLDPREEVCVPVHYPEAAEAEAASKRMKWRWQKINYLRLIKDHESPEDRPSWNPKTRVLSYRNTKLFPPIALQAKNIRAALAALEEADWPLFEGARVANLNNDQLKEVAGQLNEKQTVITFSTSKRSIIWFSSSK